MSAGQVARTAALIGAPSLLIGVLAWPMLFTHEGYNEDWIHHLWYMWNQSEAIRANHHPSFFLNYIHAVFYPMYAFYAATLYSLIGTLSLILGNAPLEAYVLSYLIAFAIAYGGWYWMGRMAGLGRWWAQLPGVIFITAAYYITLIYARGDLPEFYAVSAMPLLIASGLSVLRDERLRVLPALALGGSAVIFFGSHNITMLWGSTLMFFTAVLTLICIPSVRPWLSRRGVLRVAMLVIPGMLVSAWFLLPALAYESHTLVSNDMRHWEELMSRLMFSVSAGNIFTISRASAITPGSDFALSLPILAMAWALLAVLVRGRGALRGPWTRFLIICLGLIAALIVLMTHAGLIQALPRQYILVQFTYRLESYIMMLVSAAVLVGVLAVREATPRRALWRWALIPVAIVAIVGAIQQTDAYPRGGGNRDEVTLSGTRPPAMSTGLIDYANVDQPLRVDPYRSPTTITFPASAIHDERTSKVVHLPPHEWVYTNIAAAPEFVHISGAKFIGHDLQGNDVLEIGPSIGAAKAAARGHGGSRWTEVIAVSPVAGPPIVLGRILSVLGLAWFAAVFVVLGARRLRVAARERPRPTPAR
jgi:hypothetical protein